MPAPSFLKGLPKPILFALYGAVGGLLGALVFAEPLWQILEPKKNEPPGPEVAVGTSKEVEVLSDGENTFPIKIDRARYTGPVTVKFEKVPANVKIADVTIPEGKDEGTATIVATGAKTEPSKIEVVVDAGSAKIKQTEPVSIDLRVKEGTRPMADVIFVLDITASMQWAIDEVKSGIGQFADGMAKNKVDLRIGIVVFRDITVGETVDVLRFGKEAFTSDPEVFRKRLENVKASGGGDIPESSLEALTKAADQEFRKAGVKVLLLITDAPPKVVGDRDAAVRKTAAQIKDKGIDTVHQVINTTEDSGVYEPLLTAGVDKQPGERFGLRGIVSREESFNTLLDKFGRAVSDVAKAKNPGGEVKAGGDAGKPGVKAIQSSGEYEAGSENRLVAATGVWTGAISGLVCLVLLAGQFHYLRGQFPGGGTIAAGVIGGLVAGGIGGAAGYALFLQSPGGTTWDAIFRIIGWTLLGGLAGIGLSLFIPNLKWTHGLMGGAIGGAIGAIGFTVVKSFAGDIVGRLAGGLIVGFCIGLMVAIVEAAFRKAWLEVRFGTRETITVNLGPEPVKIGGDSRACTVWARGAADIALRYFVRDGQVICDDVVMRRESTAANGDTKEVGNVTVVVRTGASATPAGPSTRPTAPPPLPRPATPPKAPVPMSLDDDPLAFDPMPMPKPAAAPAPAAAPRPVPAPAAPPRPAAPPAPAAAPRPAAPPAAPPRPAAPPAAPPRPPAPAPGAKPSAPAPTAAAKPPSPPPPAGARNPDACPNPKCGRVNAGRPGTRYCMMCDLTY